ncbi:FecR domain-containing protein [Devosia soli]|uniref:FecR domain-containing protein n=1 Tax=Devosia soli TaxID=361041 RepID=UPI00069B6A76|nr:FecR domain-containing protein [Devosia soli]
MQKIVAAIAVSVAALLSVSTAVADEWTAVRLRGGVFALENGAWTQIVKGSVVSDDRVIKSAPGARATFVRGAETIEIGPDTTAQISDQSGFTTVYNHEGTVGIDAEARNVQHFAVQTPFLVAVVKGTAFTVQSSAVASTVTVARGTVEVEDEQTNAQVSVEAGQQVSSSEEAPISAASVVPAPADAPAPPAPAAQPRVTPAPTTSVGTGNSNSNAAAGNGSNSNSTTANNGNGGNRPGNNGNGPGNNGNGPGNGGNGPGGKGNGPGEKGPGSNGNGPGSNGNGPGGNGSGPGGGGPGGNNDDKGGGAGHEDKGGGSGHEDKGPGDKGSGGGHDDKGGGSGHEDKGSDDKGPGGDHDDKGGGPGKK